MEAEFVALSHATKDIWKTSEALKAEAELNYDQRQTKDATSPPTQYVRDGKGGS